MITIARYLILRPLLTNVLLFLLLLVSGYSLQFVQRQGMPRVDLGKVNIHTVYPGASPEDVELNVTIKLEDAIKGVSGVESYFSRSMENISFLQVTIDSDAEDMEKVKQDLRTAIERVNDLPEEVTDRPYLYEIKIDDRPIYEVAITLDEFDEPTLRHHARELKRKIMNIEDVSYVHEVGMRDREIQILLSKEKMAEKYISFDDVIRAIKLNKLRLSGGSLESYTTERGIVTLSEFKNPKDVAEIILRANLGGGYVRIGDVGRIVDGFEKANQIIKFDGRRGISLMVVKKGSADVITTVDEIKKVIENHKLDLPQKGMRFHSTWDDSIETRNRLNLLYGNAIMGLTLVVIILFMFFDWRIALWTAMGIPVSLAITLMILPVLNITLNSISLLGMVAVLGIVVDDAIIIAESIYRAKDQGMNSTDAALYGLRNVIRPVFGTILTTMIAFVPLFLIPGIVGDFSREIPTIVILTLAASFLEATTILPAHLGHDRKAERSVIEGERTADKNKNTFYPPGKYLIQFLEKIYEIVLRYSLNHRYIALLLLSLSLFGSIGMGLFTIKLDMFPIKQAFQIWLMAEIPRDSTLEYTHERASRVGKIIETLPRNAVHSYKTIVGETYDPSTDAVFYASNAFLINLILTPASDRDINAEETIQYIKNELKKIDPNNEIKMSSFILGGGPPVGSPLEIRVMGQDNEKRTHLVNQIKDDLKDFGVTDIDTDLRRGKVELRLLPDHLAIARSGLNVADIAGAIRTAYDGTVVTHQQTPDEQISFRVMMDHPELNFDNPLQNLFVRNMTGNLVPISNLVYVKKDEAPESIYHYNSYRANKVAGNIPEDGEINLNLIYDHLKKKYENFERENPGFILKIGGEAAKADEFLINMVIATMIAILAIYLILVLEFSSFMQPAMVILAIPFGFAGLVTAFAIQGLPLSMMALVGILGFSGVVVNDSLIMVDFINRLRQSGSIEDISIDEEPQDHNLTDEEFQIAVITGARMRLRAILLTTLTTVAGLIPTAYGFVGGFDSFVSPMVMAMTWGLLAGTSSVLIVIPVFYVIYGDMIKWLHNMFHKTA